MDPGPSKRPLDEDADRKDEVIKRLRALVAVQGETIAAKDKELAVQGETIAAKDKELAAKNKELNLFKAIQTGKLRSFQSSPAPSSQENPVEIPSQVIGKIKADQRELGGVQSNSVFPTYQKKKRESYTQILVREVLQFIIQTLGDSVKYDLEDHSSKPREQLVDNMMGQKIDLVFFPKAYHFLSQTFIVSFMELKHSLKEQATEAHKQVEDRVRTLLFLQFHARPELKIVVFLSDGESLIRLHFNAEQEGLHGTRTAVPFIIEPNEDQARASHVGYTIDPRAHGMLVQFLTSEPKVNFFEDTKLWKRESATFKTDDNPNQQQEGEFELAIIHDRSGNRMLRAHEKDKSSADLFLAKSNQFLEGSPFVLKCLPKDDEKENVHSYLEAEQAIIKSLKNQGIGKLRCEGWYESGTGSGLMLTPLARPVDFLSNLLGISQILRYALDLQSVLMEVHEKLGIIHADISPNNIVIHDNQPVLIDWEFAVKIGSKHGIRGTPNFWSLAISEAHLSQQPSEASASAPSTSSAPPIQPANSQEHAFEERDDIESLFFCTLYLINRKRLPWKDERERNEAMKDKGRFDEIMKSLKEESPTPHDHADWSVLEQMYTNLFMTNKGNNVRVLK